MGEGMYRWETSLQYKFITDVPKEGTIKGEGALNDKYKCEGDLEIEGNHKTIKCDPNPEGEHGCVGDHGCMGNPQGDLKDKDECKHYLGIQGKRKVSLGLNEKFDLECKGKHNVLNDLGVRDDP